MERLSLDEFIAARDGFDRAAMGSGGRAGSCWLSPWQLAGHAAMQGPNPAERQHLIYRAEGAWGAWIESSQAGVFVPFEPVWMFASPLVGGAEEAARLAARVLELHRGEVLALVVGGVPLGSRLHRALQVLPAQSAELRYGEAEGTESCLIELGDGPRAGRFDAWLGRRSKNFRRAVRRCDAPLDVELVDGAGLDPEESFARILSVQERSFKAERGEDIFAIPEYRAFYAWLLRDLHASGELRLTFAVRGGVDLAYHFGFARGHHYRGYQMSYAEEARSLGLGTVLHLAHLRRAAAEGVTRFDLGMHAPYKDRWCDRVDRSVIVFLQ